MPWPLTELAGTSTPPENAATLPATTKILATRETLDHTPLQPLLERASKRAVFCDEQRDRAVSERRADNEKIIEVPFKAVPEQPLSTNIREFEKTPLSKA